MKTVYKMVFLRHGQSIWNQENRFTGWTDVGLTKLGEQEAISSGQILKEEGFTFDIAFTSVLKRSIKTLWIVLEEMDLEWVAIINSWRLNERHYGALQGLNKAEMATKFGEEQVKLWRRSYDVPPPPLDWDDERHPRFDRRYSDLTNDELPSSESLKDTLNRTLPYWYSTLAPAVQSGKRILVSAHGNSLRALVKYLDDISDEEIVELNIPTGIPLVYELDENLNKVTSYYLGDAEAVRKAAEAVAAQGKANP